MSDQLSDTQPRNPFQDEVPLTFTIDPELEGRRSGGCLTQFLIGGTLFLLALLIVGLAGAAGWTTGQREANRLATATRSAAIDEQLRLLPADVASGNRVLLDARIQWLATQTPGVFGLDAVRITATALYNNSLPTQTPTASPTLPASPTPEAVQVVVPTPGGSGYDLVAILGQAQNAMAASQWEDAIELLDVVLAADPAYQTVEVRRLMGQALNNYAAALYNEGLPAAANLIVSRAEEFGTLAEGLSYERYAAELYLTARGSVGTGSQTAINALQELIGLGAAGRYYNQALQLLYDAYINRGDGLVYAGNPCGAVGEYQRATQVLASGTANGKLGSAQAACAAAALPTADPNWALTPGAVAPIGVPGS